MKNVANLELHSSFELKTFSIMKSWWKSHLRTFDSIAEMKRISIQISVEHMWTRLFWFWWQKKLATASPEWVNLNGNSIQCSIRLWYRFFEFAELITWVVYVSLCVCCMFVHFSLSFILLISRIKHERSIISINCLKNANFLTRTCAYVVVVP